MSCLVVAFCSLLWAKDFWESKRYTQWKPNEVEDMLTRSPWVKVQTFAEVAPSHTVQVPQVPATKEPTRPWGVEGTPSASEKIAEAGAEGRFRAHRLYYARFHSARPVRMALAQQDLLAKSVSRNQAEEFVRSRPFGGKIVVAIGVPEGHDPSELHRVTTDLLSNSTYLLLGKSKRRIPLESYLPPTEERKWEGLLLFPRQEGKKALVTLAEKEVSLICQLSEVITLNYQFKLTDMVFGGELEL
jgi:hypothetical protein